MQGSYKLFAAAMLGLALVFASTEVADRIGNRPAEASTGPASEAESPPTDAPKPVIIPAPMPPEQQPMVVSPDPAASDASASDYSPSDPGAPPPPAPAISAEGQTPAPMIIIPAEGN